MKEAWRENNGFGLLCVVETEAEPLKKLGGKTAQEDKSRVLTSLTPPQLPLAVAWGP